LQLLSNVAPGHAIRKVHENCTNEIEWGPSALFYVDDVNLFEDDINTVKGTGRRLV
jgi:hypothetical protein